MNAALISQGSVSSKWTLEAMKKYFDDVDAIDIRELEVNLTPTKPEILYKGKHLNKYDCIYAKGSFRYASVLNAITVAYERNCYMPVKHSAFTIAHDKLLTQLDLQMHNIPMPKTYIAATKEAARKILENVNYPIIMKFLQGTHGKGVMFADSFNSATSILDALVALSQPFIIQEYIDTQGTDIRAIVVGDRVVAAMKRIAAPGEERANIHSGGSGKRIELDAYTRRIAIKAAKAIGADICGVDILQSIKGPFVLEVNISPGLPGVTEATKIDVADEIAKFLAKKTKERMSKEKEAEAGRIMKDLEFEQSGKKIERLNELFTNLEFRGERILLPEVVTKITSFNEDDEFVITADKNKIVIKKFKLTK
ncbi:hypothetical protein DRJ17_03495 [Candidatus Woesearchaeota archaeon]|nr:MAG: hypothetical protein DRJ17_03495 [Candidatus Woesearchaeota archaeon]